MLMFYAYLASFCEERMLVDNCKKPLRQETQLDLKFRYIAVSEVNNELMRRKLRHKMTGIPAATKFV
jgi:hypothetical protein